MKRALRIASLVLVASASAAQSRPTTLAAEGLPYVFRSFTVVGAFDSIEQATSGVRWKETSSMRRMELPGANVVVAFE